MKYARTLLVLCILLASGCGYSRVIVEFRAQALVTPAGPVVVASKIDLSR